MVPASTWLWWRLGGVVHGRFNHGGLSGEAEGGEYNEGVTRR